MKYILFEKFSKTLKKLENVKKKKTSTVSNFFFHGSTDLKRKKKAYITYISEASGSRFVYLNYYFPKASEKKS